MQISVTGQHVEVTTSLHDYVTSKLERLERHSDQVTNIHVVLSISPLHAGTTTLSAPSMSILMKSYSFSPSTFFIFTASNSMGVP